MKPEEAIERLKCMKLFMRIKILDEDYAAYDMAIEALKKQVPKEHLQAFYVGEDNEFYKRNICPKCYDVIGEIKEYNYCPWCGQALKWE